MIKMDRLFTYTKDTNYVFRIYCNSSCCKKVIEHTVSKDNKSDAYDTNPPADDKILVQCLKCDVTHYIDRFVYE